MLRRYIDAQQSLIAMFVCLVCLSPLPVLAQVDLGMFELSHLMELPDQDPRIILVRLINIALEFSGLLLLLVILWGGVQFLFSLGKQEKMDKAKRTIINGIIGMILIVTSWAIVKFVLTSVVEAMNI